MAPLAVGHPVMAIDGAVAVPPLDGAVPEVDEAAGPSLDGAVAVPPLDGAVPEVDEAAGPSLDGAVAVPPLDGAVPEPESSAPLNAPRPSGNDPVTVPPLEPPVEPVAPAPAASSSRTRGPQQFSSPQPLVSISPPGCTIRMNGTWVFQKHCCIL